MKVLTAIFLLYSFGLLAQNLVPNPSFENISNCPVGMGEVSNAGSWDRCWNYTSDLFNSCSNATLVGVPKNIAGCQMAATGNGYAGFLCYPHAEYVVTRLTATLTIGQTYYVSFKTSRADEKTNIFGFNVAINKIGARFTTMPFPTVYSSSVTPTYPDNIAHVYANSVISDSTNWTIVQGSFVADSAYQYLVVGNFFDAAHTTAVGNTGTGTGGAYYYADDICVSSVSGDCMMDVGLADIDPEANAIVYPNPTTGLLKIVTKNESIESIIVRNMYGDEILAVRNTASAHYMLNLSSLASGMYSITVKTSYGILTKSIIKD